MKPPAVDLDAEAFLLKRRIEQIALHLKLRRPTPDVPSSEDRVEETLRLTPPARFGDCQQSSGLSSSVSTSVSIVYFTKHRKFDPELKSPIHQDRITGFEHGQRHASHGKPPNYCEIASIQVSSADLHVSNPRHAAFPWNRHETRDVRFFQEPVPPGGAETMGHCILAGTEDSGAQRGGRRPRVIERVIRARRDSAPLPRRQSTLYRFLRHAIVPRLTKGENALLPGEE